MAVTTRHWLAENLIFKRTHRHEIRLFDFALPHGSLAILSALPHWLLLERVASVRMKQIRRFVIYLWGAWENGKIFISG